MRIPQHLAIIMDGNGRWARSRNLPRLAGHARGVETVRIIVEECVCLGIPCLTLYAFSSENWQRPGDEVSGLMRLLGQFLQSELPRMQQNRIRLRAIGNLELLPEDARQMLEQTLEATSANEGMILNLALSYGSRDELVRCMQKIAVDIGRGRLGADDIDESLLSSRLDTAELPDVDLLIRTSGEIRISNFLLWQIAYAELVFTEVFWPDFGPEDLRQALEEFSQRERRFGRIFE